MSGWRGPCRVNHLDWHLAGSVHLRCDPSFARAYFVPGRGSQPAVRSESPFGKVLPVWLFCPSGTQLALLYLVAEPSELIYEAFIAELSGWRQRRVDALVGNRSSLPRRASAGVFGQ